MCLAGKKEQIMFSQQHGKTPENALITFIFINWGIIIHFTTNWSLGAPVIWHSLFFLYANIYLSQFEPLF